MDNMETHEEQPESRVRTGELDGICFSDILRNEKRGHSEAEKHPDGR